MRPSSAVPALVPRPEARRLDAPVEEERRKLRPAADERERWDVLRVMQQGDGGILAVAAHHHHSCACRGGASTPATPPRGVRLRAVRLPHAPAAVDARRWWRQRAQRVDGDRRRARRLPVGGAGRGHLDPRSIAHRRERLSICTAKQQQDQLLHPCRTAFRVRGDDDVSRRQGEAAAQCLHGRKVKIEGLDQAEVVLAQVTVAMDRVHEVEAVFQVGCRQGQEWRRR